MSRPRAPYKEFIPETALHPTFRMVTWATWLRSMSGRILVNTAERDIHFRRFTSSYFFFFFNYRIFLPIFVTCQITQNRYVIHENVCKDILSGPFIIIFFILVSVLISLAFNKRIT